MTREVLIDCDQVLSNFILGVEQAAGLPGWTPAPCWDFASNLPPDLQQQVHARWKRPGFIRNLPLIPGAQEGIARVRDEVPVRIVTAMEGWGYQERLEWLWEHFRIEEAQVTFAVDKGSVPGLAMLDDHTHHLRQWNQVCGRTTVLFGAPHNAGQAWPLRVESWEEAAQLLLRISRGEL